MIVRHEKIILLLLLVAGFAINLATVHVWEMAYIANDGIQYISTAKNWLSGNGFSTDVLMYTPHFQGRFPAAQTVWPPGYPLAIALVSKAGLDTSTAALILNLITHACAALAMWALLVRMGVGRYFACLCAFAFYFMAMPWAFVTAGLTEPLFTTLLLLALLLLPDPIKSGVMRWILCGLVIAACIYVRYSSVFFTFGTGAGIFLYLILSTRSSVSGFSVSAIIRPGIKLFILVSMPVLTFALLMYRTNTLIGTLDRYSGSKQPETLLSTFNRWAAKSSELLGFAEGQLISGPTASLLFVVFMVLVVIVFALFFFQTDALKLPLVTNNATYLTVVVLATLFHGIALIVYLTINSMDSSPLEIITRYLYQIYPGFYAIFCFVLFATAKNLTSKIPKALLTTVTTLLLVMYVFGQINWNYGTRVHYFSGANASKEMMQLPVTDTHNLKAFIKKCFSTEDSGLSIWSTHGQSVHLHTGVPTLTHSEIYAQQFDPEHLHQRVERYKVGMFLFVNFPEKYGTQYDNYMVAAKSWLDKQGYKKVALQSNSFGRNQSLDLYTKDPICGI